MSSPGSPALKLAVAVYLPSASASATWITAPAIRATLVAAMVAVLAWIMVGVPSTGAEWFADLCGGSTIAERSRFSLDGNLDGAAVTGLMASVKFEKSFIVGGLGRVLVRVAEVLWPDINPRKRPESGWITRTAPAPALPAQSNSWGRSRRGPSRPVPIQALGRNSSSKAPS